VRDVVDDYLAQNVGREAPMTTSTTTTSTTTTTLPRPTRGQCIDNAPRQVAAHNDGGTLVADSRPKWFARVPHVWGCVERRFVADFVNGPVDTPVTM